MRISDGGLRNRGSVVGLSVILLVLLVGVPGGTEVPATCSPLGASPRDPYLHFTAWEDRDGVIRGRLKNTHPFELARAAAIRLTFSLNSAGGGFQGSYCLALGDIPPGDEVPFRFVRPPEVATVPHVKQNPRALW